MVGGLVYPLPGTSTLNPVTLPKTSTLVVPEAPPVVAAQFGALEHPLVVPVGVTADTFPVAVPAAPVPPPPLIVTLKLVYPDPEFCTTTWSTGPAMVAVALAPLPGPPKLTSGAVWWRLPPAVTFTAVTASPSTIRRFRFGLISVCVFCADASRGIPLTLAPVLSFTCTLTG